ncbi:MAG: molybdopterin biosynthesis protein [Nitrososphaerales archaeon]|nr:molybdopterin biosynthesis protein [Nitrososphaerales archaeon]
MSRSIFKRLVTVDEALNALKGHVKPLPLGIEEVKITETYGRILGEDIVAKIDLPPFSRAIVDGYAVRAIATSFASEVNPVKFKVVGRVYAGEGSSLEIKEKECIEIDTGAILPRGADAVVRVEDTSIDGDYAIIHSSLGKGSGVATMGSDVYNGQLVMEKGEGLTAEKIGALAGLGYGRIKVFLRPRVAIFSTGNELLEPGLELSPSKIYDVNQYSIGALVQSSGCIPIYLGVKIDNFEEIRGAIVEGLNCADAIVMSGGTSAGVSDLAYKVFEGLGSPGLIVHGIAAKPGKPTILAAIGDKPIFGLPGFPVSALTMYYLIVDPFLRSISGKKLETRKTLKSGLATRHISERGRREYLPVFLKRSEKGLVAVPILGGSGAIASLCSADGIVEIPENIELIEKDERVKVRLFPQVKVADLVMVGDPSPVSQLVLSELRRSGVRVRSEFRGLEHGLALIRSETADLLVACTPEDERALNLYDFPSKIAKIGSFKMDMVWAFYGEGALSSGSTLVLPKIGSGLRAHAEDRIRKMAKDFKVIEVWSYDAAVDQILNRRDIVALLPLRMAKKYGLGFVEAFPTSVNYLAYERLLSTRVGKRLLRIMKSEDFRSALAPI